MSQLADTSHRKPRRLRLLLTAVVFVSVIAGTLTLSTSSASAYYCTTVNSCIDQWTAAGDADRDATIASIRSDAEQFSNVPPAVIAFEIAALFAVYSCYNNLEEILSNPGPYGQRAIECSAATATLAYPDASPVSHFVTVATAKIAAFGLRQSARNAELALSLVGYGLWEIANALCTARDPLNCPPSIVPLTVEVSTLGPAGYAEVALKVDVTTNPPVALAAYSVDPSRTSSTPTTGAYVYESPDYCDRSQPFVDGVIAEVVLDGADFEVTSGIGGISVDGLLACMSS